MVSSRREALIGLDATWRVVELDAQGVELLRRPRESTIGRNLWELYPTEVDRAFYHAYKLAMDERRSVAIQAYSVALGAWFHVRAVPSERGLVLHVRHADDPGDDPDASGAGMLGESRILEQFFENATDLIHALSPDGHVLYANRSWRETLGYSASEVPALRLTDVVAPEWRAGATRALSSSVEGRPTRDLELCVLSKDGRRFTIRGNALVRHEPDGASVVWGIYRDITSAAAAAAAEQGARAAAEAANRAKSEFLDRVSHELRTPLTGILGFAQLLTGSRSVQMQGPQLQMVEAILRQGRRLLTIVEDVLAYTEIEGGRAQLRVDQVAVDELLREVAAEFRAEAERRGLALTVTTPARSARLATDASRLRQVVRHLVDNAVKFTNAGSVAIALETDPTTHRPTRFTVRDTGVGMAAESITAMLTVFAQGDVGDARRTEGLGLGLALARSLCQALGFQLDIASEPEQGTTATIVLDRDLDGRSEAALGVAQPAPTAPGTGTPARQVERDDSATLLHGVIGAAPLAIVAFDTDGTVRLWNPAAEKIYGWPVAEAVGRRLPTVPPADEEELRMLLRTAVEHGAVTDRVVRRRRRDGSTIYLNVSIAALRDGRGRLLGFASMGADVTERRRLEDELRQAQRMEIVGRLAGGIAHDFNNLLTVVSVSAEFLLESLESEDERRADVLEIKKAGQRAAQLTRQLLVFARKEVPRREPVDLAALVGNLEKMLRRVIPSTNELAAIVPSTPCPVFADPGQLEQLVMNLVVNARDAMPHGGAIVIEVAAEDAPAQGAAPASGRPARSVVLSVSDTGAGMDEATRARIFEPFFTTKPQGTGTGLGLATVYGIVTASGGRIEVDSAPGRGSTFRVYLPMLSGAAIAAAPEAGPAVAGGTETVLLVEDQTAVRDVAARMLRARGYTVIEARHGADALQLAARHAIDVLVTDVVMPELDGPELAARMAKQRPDLRVVYITGYTDGEQVPVGTAPIVHKPFNAHDLAAAVRRALDAGRDS